MRKIINLIYILNMIIISVFFTSCTSSNITTPVKNTEYVEIDQENKVDEVFPSKEIPILAWWGVQEHTVERYRELKECGINYNLTMFMNEEQLPKALDAAGKENIKMIIHCFEMEKDPEKITSRFKDHPALAGYHIIDEPNSNDFPYWGELVRRIQTVDNKNFCYVNLYPNGLPAKRLGTKTYREYVKLLLEKVPVQFLSFDKYPIKIYGSGVRILNNTWYENLEIISDESRKARKTFWAFALTTAHGNYPIPTIADLRLQVFNNLAYGAQGIQYFTYWTPQSDTTDFHDGPIDYSGLKTAVWDIVQQMNMEIKALSKVFYGAKVIQVRHIVKNAFGINGFIPKGTTRFDFTNRPEEASIIEKINISKKTKAVISFLKNDKRCYMVIINRNLSGGDNITFTITGGEGLQLIKKDGTAVPASSEDSNRTITPGDVLIYGWDIK